MLRSSHFLHFSYLQFPLLQPGEEFVYESCTAQSSSPGSIEGAFTFVPGRYVTYCNCYTIKMKFYLFVCNEFIISYYTFTFTLYSVVDGNCSSFMHTPILRGQLVDPNPIWCYFDLEVKQQFCSLTRFLAS